MGRQKATPSKLSTTGALWGYDQQAPIKKRRKQKKKNNFRTTSILPVTEESKTFHLGQLLIGTTKNPLPNEWSTCKSHFSSSDGVQHFILDFDGSIITVILSIDSSLLKVIITSKVFAVRFYNNNEDCFIDIYFLTLPLPKFTTPLGTCIRELFFMLYGISSNFEGTDRCSDQLSGNEIAQLYWNIKALRGTEVASSQFMKPAKLKPELRPYQAEAVKWMIGREKECYKTDNEIHPLYTTVTLRSGFVIYYDKYSGYIDVNKPLVETPSRGGILADEMGLGKTVEVLACILLHTKISETVTTIVIPDSPSTPTVDKITRKRTLSEEKPSSSYIDESKKVKVREDWVKGSSKKSQVRVALELWYNNCLQGVGRSEPYSPQQSSVQCVCGKDYKKGTVECEDCGKTQHSVCLGYKRKYGPYRCPQCWMNQPFLEVGATLIVVPVSLRTQWCNEICKHVSGDFRVLQYGGSSVAPIYPPKFSEYDVVITSYNVLQSELRLTETQKEISFRNQRKYSPPGSPLARIKWWRLCLDEAQTVEAPTSMVSAMAQKLSAHIRWAVTGTPISKEVSDLYGLIDYLQMSPYNDKQTWQHLLFNPYIQGNPEPMFKFLSQVLWRSFKSEIINQINIPPQTLQEYWLDFSAVEHHFYKCEHKHSRNMFLESTKSHDPSQFIHDLDQSSWKKLCAPLLWLRIMCTYPNGARTRYLATRKPMHSLKDLLDALVEKNSTENEEFLRAVLCTLNGLAGVNLLLQFPLQAIEHYRKVLQLYVRFNEEEKFNKISVDKLQVIHAMHNLSEVLSSIPTETLINRTLRDDNLVKDCTEIEKNYMDKYIRESLVAQKEFLVVFDSIAELESKFIRVKGQWYSDLYDWIYIQDYTTDLYEKVENLHTNTNVQLHAKNLSNFVYHVASWNDELTKCRKKSIDNINSLFTHSENQLHISSELVNQAIDCHLRPQKNKKNKNKCLVCLGNDLLKAYECKLFSIVMKTEQQNFSVKGGWKPTSEELQMKAILSVGKAKNGDPELIQDGQLHINYLDTAKKEFKELRKLWTFLDQQVCAQDELNMCKIRLQMKEEDENEANKKETASILKNLTYALENKYENIHVLDEQELEYQKVFLHSEEQDNMANLERNLGVRNYLETLHKQTYEGQSPDPCPICKNALEKHWSIIPCGHSYCIECIQNLIHQTRNSMLQCCVCRANHLATEISYIKQDQCEEPEESKIKGNFSTKVEAIIRLIRNLKTEDPKVKILLFSSFLSVLRCIRDALQVNDMLTELATTSKLEKEIEKFKNDPNINTLLLHIRLGGKGLNLIEATHVILVEPLLNSGDEFQAIGRVHRIGQTKPTVVHKFFIKNTIEETIYKSTTSNSKNWEKNKITLSQLTDLFTTAECTNEDPIPEQDE